MNSRNRMTAAITYKNPDKIPVIYHPSPAGLHTHGEKLLRLFQKYPPDNDICINSIPSPPPSTIANGEYHELKPDNWGTTWEYKYFGIAGTAVGYPFKNWREAAHYSFPPISMKNYKKHVDENLHIDRAKANYLTMGGGISIFEKLHALQPMDDVLVDLITLDNDLLAFIDRLVEYYVKVIDYQSSIGGDIITFGDDWGTQNNQLISTELFRRIFKPRYKILFDYIKEKNMKILFHSCGKIDSILHELLELEIDILWPQINIYENEILELCRQKRISILIHPDRQHLIPFGKPVEIQEKIKYYADFFHDLGGGGIFYVEIENDAPFENVQALFEAIDNYR